MLTKILRKDLKRRKGVNMILCLFILLATVFLSSSLNNILTVWNGIDYYLDYANIPGLTLMLGGTSEEQKIGDFLKSREDVREVVFTRMVTIPEEDIQFEKEGKISNVDMGGRTVYLGDVGQKYCKVFDQDNKEITVKKGEAALSVRNMEENNLEPGDALVLQAGGKKREFVIKCGVKDAAFGADMGGMVRILLNEEELAEIVDADDSGLFGVAMIDCRDVNELTKAISGMNFATVTTGVDRAMYNMLYSMDMVLAAMLILVGVCFILIAFLVLRFTLVFTMEENYSEIGIMQAIGMRSFAIRRIYLVKYLLLVAVGTTAGLFISAPVSRAMVKSISKNIILAGQGTYWWANVAGAAFVAVLVLLFCYGCTRKINKLSAVDAIRGGKSGERYHRRRGLKLSARTKLPVPIYLGLNDIFSNFRRYMVLIITFCFSFVLISIPLNTVNTMKSSEMISKFLLNPDSSVYMSSFFGKGVQGNMDVKELDERVEKLKKDLKEKGYEADITVPYIFNMNFSQKENGNITIATIQIKGDTEYMDYSEGMAPELENEIAFSKQILETNGWKIGDTVHTTIHGEEKDFLITGSYSDYMQLGKSARLNSRIDMSSEKTAFFWSLMVHMDTELTQEAMKEELKKELPQYTWAEAQEILDSSIGGIQTVFDKILIPMTGLLCAVIALIVIMMEQLFVVREKGEIAMMKSMGFWQGVLRQWQTMRMVWVVLVSMIIAVPLSVLSNEFLLKPIFGIMGAEVDIQVDVLQAYVIYPGVLLAVIILAAAWASSRVKSIHIRELNNLE